MTKSTTHKMTAVEFRHQQATKAQEHPWFKELRPGPARNMALAMLREFPTVEVEKSGPTRTELAEMLAFGSLDADEANRVRAVEHGANVTRRALRWAYEELGGRQAAAA